MDAHSSSKSLDNRDAAGWFRGAEPRACAARPVAMMRPFDWMDLAFDSWRLGVEASSVMTLRMAKLAQGDAAAVAEAQRMVGEKLEAAAALQMRALTGTLGATPHSQAKAAIAHYRKAVGRNQQRLGKPKRKG